MYSVRTDDKRIRRFYKEIDEILGAVDVKWQDFYRESYETQTNAIQHCGNRQEHRRIRQRQSPLPLLGERKASLRSAIASDDVSQLENAIAWAEFDGVQAELRNEIFDAKERMRQLNDIEKVRLSMRDLKQRVISEIHSYHKPPPILHTIMLCTFLILGIEDEKHLRRWEELRTLLRRRGKGSLFYKLNHFDKSQVDKERAERVEALLSEIDFRSAADVSEGAAIFHSWLTDMIRIHHRSNKNSKRIKN